MLLFTILLLTLIILVVFTVLAVSAGGAIFIVIFGDVIVCACIIVGLISLIIKRKRNRT